MRRPVKMLAAVLATLVLLSLFRPLVVNAGTGVYPIGTTGISLTMTTPDTHSLCSSGSDRLTITGMPSNGSFHLLGHVTAQYVLESGRQIVPGGLYTVDTTSNLDLLISYPPIDQWPVQSNHTAEIHVDISIEVDVNGVKLATLGPGQQWDVFCRNRPVASVTPTNTSTNTPTATSTNTVVVPSATATSTPSATSTATPTSTASATSTATSTSTTVGPSATPTHTPNITATNTPPGAPSATLTNTPTNTGGHSATATLTPTNSGGAVNAAPSPTATVVAPAGIPVTGDGPGMREIVVMLLVGLGTGALILAGAVSLAGRARRRQ